MKKILFILFFIGFLVFFVLLIYQQNKIHKMQKNVKENNITNTKKEISDYFQTNKQNSKTVKKYSIATIPPIKKTSEEKINASQHARKKQAEKDVVFDSPNLFNSEKLNDSSLYNENYVFSNGELKIIIIKKLFKLEVFDGDIKVKEYPIAIGKDEKENKTPEGIFHVELVENNPTWYPSENLQRIKNVPSVVLPGPDNPLGKRWIGIGGSMGIHGTNDPDSIGTASSHGCIRMHNHDVIDLADIIRHSKSVIVEIR